MKVLVTGCTGQLARALIVLAQGRSDIEFMLAGRPELDLEVSGSAERAIIAISPDIVINCAAYTAVDRAEDEPERAFRINADAAGEVAQAAWKTGAPIIQISTDYVFDGAVAEPYREGAPTNPLNVYGLSKLAGEEQVRHANPNHLILRTAWLYSPFGTNFVKTTMMLATTKEELAVIADQRGNPTSALDLAAGLTTILQRWRSVASTGVGETFHLAGSGEATWFDLAVAVLDEAARIGLPTARVRPIRTCDLPPKANRPPSSTLDSSKFLVEFDFQMPLWRHSLREVVRSIGEVGTIA